MPDIPPPNQYASYPRSHSQSTYGTAEQLKALGDGYFGLYKVFIVNIVLNIASNIALRAGGFFAFLVCAIVSAVAVTVLSLPENKKITFGQGKPDSKAMVASVLTGLTFFICCGAIGYAVMQSAALKEMKKYGLKPGLWGLRKKDYLAIVDNWNHAASTPPTSYEEPPK